MEATPLNKVRDSASVPQQIPPVMLGDRGLSSQDVLNRRKGVATSVEVAGRPSNIIWRMTNRSLWWQYYALMDFYRSEVSILDTIISRSVTEIFRYGIDFEPAFVVKCVACGTEYENNVKVCPYCNSTKLRKPEEKQKDYFVRPDGKTFLEEVNDNQQTLKDLCRMYAESQYQNNQAYLLAITGDVVDNTTKKLIHSYPLEFICIDPKFVRMLYDDEAEPGVLYGFTQDDRMSCIPLSQDPSEFHDKTMDGKTIYPAYWQVGDSYGASGKSWYYTKDEVYQNHWFKQSMTYGVPHWLSIEDDLLTYHYQEKHALKRWKYGITRRLILLPGYDESAIQEVTEGIQQVLARNDNSVPIVGVPLPPQGITPQQPSNIELASDSSGDMISSKNEIRDRLCAHAGVPNLFAGDVEGSGGLNNESQQITTFDRYLMDKYDYTDDMLDWILSYFPKITDWKLRVVRPSKADQANKKLQEEIQIAQGMKNLGFKVTYTNGEFTYSEQTVDQGQGMMMGGNNPSVNTQQGFRGNNDGFGGNPDTEQNDTEQNDTEDEVDESMDEMGSSPYMASLKKRDNSFRISQGDLRRAISKISL